MLKFVLKRINKSAIYLFIPLVPIFEIYIKNYYIIDKSEKNYLLYFSLYTFGFFLLINYIFKNKNLITSSLALIYFVSFNYKNVTDFAVENAPPLISKIPNYAFIVWFLILSSFLILNLFYLERDFYKNFLIIFFFISIINSLYILNNSQIKVDQAYLETQTFDYEDSIEVEFKKKPDIYIVVFDGMANLETAKKYYDFNSEETRNILQNIDYSINEYSTSPYGQSIPTMASILNLKYLFNKEIVSFSERSILLSPFNNTQSITYDIFIDNNYEIFLMGKIFPCKSKLENIHCIESYGYESTSYNLLINTPVAIIVNNRSSFPNIYNFVSNIFNFDCAPDCSEKTFDEISKEISSIDNPTKPNLILLHYMYTHEPFTVKSDCSNRKNIIYNYPIYNKEAYRDSIMCSFKQLVDLENYTDNSDFIIAMSDHGPFYYSKVDYISNLTENDIDNRYKTFLAYKIDDKFKCEFNNDFQSVNIFRALLNCLGNTDLNLLEIKSYFMSYGTQRGSINYGNENVDLIEVNFYED